LAVDRTGEPVGWPWRIVVAVAASPGSTAWRCISGIMARMAAGSSSAPAGAPASTQTSDWSWAVEP
jgi:hypothetical protein